MRWAPFATLLLSIAWGRGVVGCGAGVSSDPFAQRTRASAGGQGSGGAGVSGGSASGGAATAAGGGAGESGSTEPGRGPEQPTGATGCTEGRECESGVCLPDVAAVNRCCEADCRALDRVCSTAGQCVCAEEKQEVGGACLLRAGEHCRESQVCASNHCVDGVCCESACSRVCERCDAPSRAGQCVLFEEDASCVEERPGFVCTARGRCRLPNGRSCGVDADCDSEECEAAQNGQRLCCATACAGVCQSCGAAGVCDDFPILDDACSAVTCPEDSLCAAYRTPARGECSENGECARCEATYQPAGTPCGSGSQCGSMGSCDFTGLRSVAAGERHTCAIRATGSVVCWGRNSEGQLGAAFGQAGEVVPLELAEAIDFDEPVVAVTAGYGHTCVLLLGGDVKCWGLGDGSGSVPALLGIEAGALVLEEHGFVAAVATASVRLSAPALQISAGPNGSHTCALLRNGNVSCWGANDEGQCGVGDDEPHVLADGEMLPILDFGGLRVLEVGVSSAHSCVLLEDGSVSCWGAGRYGRLGYGSSTAVLRPFGPVPLGEPARAIAVGGASSCALLEGGRVRCWGRNNNGQLGYGHAENVGDDETPEQAVSMSSATGRRLGGDVELGGGNVAQLSAVVASEAFCARFSGGAVRCWGENRSGELGYGHDLNGATSHTPFELAGQPAPGGFEGGDLALGGAALALAEGGRCALVATADAETAARPLLYCWGKNQDGQLGFAPYPLSTIAPRPLELGPVDFR